MLETVLPVATLIVGVLVLAAVIASHLIIPSRIEDIHASVTSAWEAIETHMEQASREDPRVVVLSAENAELRRQQAQALDRVMALTHPAYLASFRRQQMEAAGVKPRQQEDTVHYGEFGEELPRYPVDRKEFEAIMASKRNPSVAPPEAKARPTPAKAS